MIERSEYSPLIQKVANWNKLEKGTIIRLLHVCIENGFTAFDVSGVFENQSMESSFGTALSESGLSRDEIQLITRINLEDMDNVEEHVEKLLLQLGVDYLDLLILEDIQDIAHSAQLLEKLSTQAKLSEFGIVGLPPGPFQETGLKVRVFQTSFELLSNRILHKLEVGQSEGERWRVFIDWPVHQPSGETLNNAFTDLVKKYEVSQQDLFLLWLLQHPVSFNFMVGGNTETEIDRFGKLKQVKLHPFDWKKIKLILTD